MNLFLCIVVFSVSCTVDNMDQCSWDYVYEGIRDSFSIQMKLLTHCRGEIWQLMCL